MGELLTGVSRVGPYRVDGLLGRGGMATVYLGYHESLERPVAIKVMPAAVTGTLALKRLRQEAVTVAKLRHPNILGVYDYGIDRGLAYLVTDLVDGGTLEQRLVEPLDLLEVVALLAPIASALDHAHGQGVLHRDVKPGNILLRSDGTPVLADFGLVKVLAGSDNPTESNMVMGTPAYMAPEQGTGEDLTPAADVYSLAVTAYHALAGRLPFDGRTGLALLLAHMRDPVPPVREAQPHLSDKVDRALLRGLAKMPADRPGSASELVESLRVADRRRRPAPLSRPTRVIRAVCRVAGSLAAAALLLAVAAGAAQSAAAHEVVYVSVPDTTAAHRDAP
jgi:serine/threonine protein kinase